MQVPVVVEPASAMQGERVGAGRRGAHPRVAHGARHPRDQLGHGEREGARGGAGGAVARDDDVDGGARGDVRRGGEGRGERAGRGAAVVVAAGGAVARSGATSTRAAPRRRVSKPAVVPSLLVETRSRSDGGGARGVPEHHLVADGRRAAARRAERSGPADHGVAARVAGGHAGEGARHVEVDHRAHRAGVVGRGPCRPGRCRGCPCRGCPCRGCPCRGCRCRGCRCRGSPRRSRCRCRSRRRCRTQGRRPWGSPGPPGSRGR